MDDLINRLQKWKHLEHAGPYIVQLHLTNQCNLSCDFCPTVAMKEQQEVDYTEELSKDQWMDIIDEGEEIGIKEWHICGGGEPLFDKEAALDIMERIKNYGARGELITNGTLVDEEVAERIVDMDWDVIVFSIDGPNKEINDQIRDKGSFEMATKGAKKISKKKREKQSYLPSKLTSAVSLLVDISTKPHLVVQTVISNKNYDRIDKMIKLTDRLGFDEIRFKDMNTWNEAGEKMTMNSSEIDTLKREIKRGEQVAEKIDVDMNVPASFNARELEEKIGLSRKMGRLVGLMDSLGVEDEQRGNGS